MGNRPTLWFNPCAGVSRAEREWLVEKVPRVHVADDLVPEDAPAVLPAGVPAICSTMATAPMCSIAAARWPGSRRSNPRARLNASFTAYAPASFSRCTRTYSRYEARKGSSQVGIATRRCESISGQWRKRAPMFTSDELRALPLFSELAD